VQAYLDRKDVQQAIHANTTLPFPWTVCSSVVQYSRASLLSSMLPVYDELIKAKLRMLVYSGDVDAIVPVTGTMAWVASLNLTVTSPKKPWYVPCALP
jgi:serine carboxypeptidase-like clade 2